jgi:hypothetical protein
MEQKSRIRTLFLQPSESYNLAEGARLLGIAPATLRREAEDDRREEYRSGDPWRAPPMQALRGPELNEG